MNKTALTKPALTLFVGVAMLILLAAAPTTGYAQEGAPITGQVINGTAGGRIPTGLAVFVLVSDESGALVYSGQTETDPEGRFSFPVAASVPGGRYLFNTLYSGVDYNQTLTWDQLGEGISLTVYETTQDISIIKITRQVLVIADVDPKSRMISALEFVRISNTSGYTLNPILPVKEAISFLRFSLPPGTAGLNVNSDLPSREIISIGTGFAVTSPIVPGEHSIEYSFTFPYEGDEFSYRQNLLQGAAVYQVMAPQALPSIRVEPLIPVAPVDIQGTGYRVWEINGLAPGQGFTLKASNLPEPSALTRLAATLSGASFWQTAIPVSLGAALALVLALGIVTRPRAALSHLDSTGGDARSSPMNQRDDFSGSREELLRELAALDLSFELGRLPPAEYNFARQALKDRVLELPQPTQNPADAPSADIG